MPAVDRRLLRASRAARTQLGLAVALGCGTAVAIVAQAALLATVIDRAFLGGASPADVRDELIALLAVVAVRAVLAGGFEVSGRLGAERALADLRAQLVDHVLRRRPAGLERTRTGALAAAAVQGVDALEAYFARYLPQLVLAALAPPAIVVFLAFRDPVAAGVLALTLPLIPLFMVLIGRSAQDRTRARWRTLGVLSGHFLDVVRGLDTLRAHDRAHAQAETIAAVSDRFRTDTMGTLRLAFMSALVLELLAMMGTALAAATVGVQLVGGSLGLTAGLTVLLLAPELYAPLRQLGAQFHASADGLAAAEEIFACLEAPPAVAPVAGARPAPDPARAPVRLEAVGFAYPDRPAAALDGICLALAPGERVALVGPNGAGKSTLAALLLRLADPTAGRITCGDADLRNVDPRAWRQRIAWVPQRPTMFAASVADNIRVGAPAATDERVRAAAEAAGVLGFAAELPQGLATRIGDGGRPLSAGQAERVALARAFLRAAPLLILDEPTAHLDPASARALAEAVERLAAGRTTLLIAHDVRLALAADRVVRLAGGRVAADQARAPLAQAVA
jgi:thiol reductant ABC exporter CydD subunit